jgi:hypothetical protein
MPLQGDQSNVKKYGSRNHGPLANVPSGGLPQPRSSQPSVPNDDAFGFLKKLANADRTNTAHEPSLVASAFRFCDFPGLLSGLTAPLTRIRAFLTGCSALLATTANPF